MGFLEKAKKLAEQASKVAEQAKELAEGAMSEARARTASSSDGGGSAPPSPADPRLGTPYVPGMLGRPGWREQGLTDPAAILPIAERDRVGVPHTTRSEIVEEPFGMGRRWTAGERSLGLFYRLHPEQRAWAPPGGASPVASIPRASQASLSDGRALVFLADGDRQVVLETIGIDDAARSDLVHAVASQLAS